MQSALHIGGRRPAAHARAPRAPGACAAGRRLLWCRPFFSVSALRAGLAICQCASRSGRCALVLPPRPPHAWRSAPTARRLSARPPPPRGGLPPAGGAHSPRALRALPRWCAGRGQGFARATRAPPVAGCPGAGEPGSVSLRSHRGLRPRYPGTGGRPAGLRPAGPGQAVDFLRSARRCFAVLIPKSSKTAALIFLSPPSHVCHARSVLCTSSAAATWVRPAAARAARISSGVGLQACAAGLFCMCLLCLFAVAPGQLCRYRRNRGAAVVVTLLHIVNSQGKPIDQRCRSGCAVACLSPSAHGIPHALKRPGAYVQLLRGCHTLHSRPTVPPMCSCSKSRKYAFWVLYFLPSASRAAPSPCAL